MAVTISGNGEINTPNSDKGLDIGGMMSFDNFMHVQDQKPSGTSGGSSVGGEQTRDLNEVVHNTILGASLNIVTGVMTFPAGSYYFDAVSNRYINGHSQAYIYNDSDASIEVLGISGYGEDSVGTANTGCTVSGMITIASEKDITLRQYLSAGVANGLGIGTVSGNDNVYSDVKIWKVG